MNERMLVVANPASSGFTGGLHRSVLSILSRRFDVESVWSQSPAHAREAVAEAIGRGVELIAPMGGDGILHHVAQPAVETGSSIVPLPSGTMNVMARLLGIPNDPRKAAKAFAKGHRLVERPTLRMVVTVDGTTSRHHGVFSLGAGPDAEIVERAEAEPFRKYRFGGLHYARSSFGTVWSDLRHQRPSLTVTANGHETSAIGALCQMYEVYTFFGRVPIRVDRLLPDPLSVLVIGRLPMRRTPRIAARLIRSRPLDAVKDLTIWRHVEEVTIEGEPFPVHSDGELIGRAERVEASYRPASLQFAVPEHG